MSTQISTIHAAATTEHTTLHHVVTQMMQRYFDSLAGEKPSNIYWFALEEFERPLLESVLSYTNGNQSEAARIMGISRGTLRKKMKQYGLL